MSDDYYYSGQYAEEQAEAEAQAKEAAHLAIFGYTWDEIKRAQQGGALARRIPAGIYKPLATDGDWELLERYGEAELRNRGYFGVLDRLENTRLANDMPDCDRSACRDHSLRACDNHD